MKILFVCVHNSARSQIAEEYTRLGSKGKVEAESAGLEPGMLNPYVIKALLEDGIDISNKKTQSVFELYKKGNTYDYVITVCSKEAEAECPVFPGNTQRLNWPFEDPALFKGSDEEIMDQVRHVRDRIKDKTIAFLNAIVL
jgi:arsenate reductase (thioredoxin)